MKIEGWLRDLLRCPRCGHALEGSNGLSCGNRVCGLAETPFGIVGGQPVLIDFEQSIVSAGAFADRDGASYARRRQSGPAAWARRMLGGRNRVAERVSKDLLQRLPHRAVILTIGGGTVGNGARALYSRPDIRLVGSDVYASEQTSVVADAHQLPFADAQIDAVWIQAVLEHVLDPTTVAREIHRVLRPNGYVFADTPFMQQVHEGAYDFTRYTLSGHRWLFRDFSVLDTGVSGGAGTALVWSIRYFVRAVTGSNKAALLCALPWFWLRWLDRSTPKHEDAASGVYFYGRKGDGLQSSKDIIEFYADRAEAGLVTRGEPSQGGRRP